MDPPSPSPFLQTFISKTLRITTTDTRVFIGELKCTDKAKNLILARTHEYRYPSTRELAAVAERLERMQGVEGGDSEGGNGDESRAENVDVEGEKVRLALKSRYIGLVVVPGEYVVKVEVEDGVGGRPAGMY